MTMSWDWQPANRNEKPIPNHGPPHAGNIAGPDESHHAFGLVHCKQFNRKRPRHRRDLRRHAAEKHTGLWNWIRNMPLLQYIDRDSSIFRGIAAVAGPRSSKCLAMSFQVCWRSFFMLAVALVYILQQAMRASTEWSWHQYDD